MPMWAPLMLRRSRGPGSLRYRSRAAQARLLGSGRLRAALDGKAGVSPVVEAAAVIVDAGVTGAGEFFLGGGGCEGMGAGAVDDDGGRLIRDGGVGLVEECDLVDAAVFRTGEMGSVVILGRGDVDEVGGWLLPGVPSMRCG